ncbi:MAG: RNA polymerase sigma factor [Crocinitomicaceae bacterium]
MDEKIKRLIKIVKKATKEKEYRLSNENNVENSDQLKEIIRGCIENNRKSQEQLFKLFYGKMMSVCMRYHRNPDDAQEILQVGFIKVFEKLGAYDHTGSFEGWLRRIFANTAIDAIRKSKKDPIRKDKDEEFVLDSVNPVVEEEEIELKSLKAEIALEAINQLTPAYRAVFNLYVIEEYTHKEIGELLGVTEGTSKSNLAKAKMNLQKILKEKFEKIDQ